MNYLPRYLRNSSRCQTRIEETIRSRHHFLKFLFITGTSYNRVIVLTKIVIVVHNNCYTDYKSYWLAVRALRE